MPPRAESKNEMKQTTAFANQTELCIDEIPFPDNDRSRLTGHGHSSEPESRRNSSRANVRGSVDVSIDMASKTRKLSVLNPSHPNHELTATLGKIKTLIDEASLLSIEHQFIDQTMFHLSANPDCQSTEFKELFLLAICERYLNQTATYLQNVRKDKSVPLIEAIETQNDRVCETIREKSNQSCPRKWNSIKLSSELMDEEIRTLNLQLERIIGFKQALQSTHDEFFIENQLYLEFLDKSVRKTDEEITSMTSDDINRAQIIAQTLLADCQGKMLGDLSEIKESNAFLQNHLKEFEKDSLIKKETFASFDQLKSKLSSTTVSGGRTLMDEMAELKDQISEIQHIESLYSLKESEVKEIFNHLEEKMNRESARFPALQKDNGNTRGPDTGDNSMETLMTLYKLYEMRDQVERDLESELATLVKEESELHGVAKVFDDLKIVPNQASKLNSHQSSAKQILSEHSTNRAQLTQNSISNCFKPRS